MRSKRRTVLGSIRGAIAHYRESRSTLASPDAWLTSWFRGGSATFSGVNVNETTALNYTAVYAAVQILANTIGSLPLEIRRTAAGGFSDEAREHPLWDILHDAANPEMDAMQFRETLQGHVATWGNAYAHQIRDAAGRLEALWPLRPDWMRIERSKLTGRLLYRYRTQTGVEQIFQREEIFHLSGWGFDGIQGYSPITMAREAIALGMGTEEFGSRFFSNGSNHGGVLEHPGPQPFSTKAHDRLRKEFAEKTQGLENAHKPLILEEGMTWKSIGIPAKDAQFLETRRFQLEEIARMYRVPLHLMQNLDKATFNNIQELGISFVTYTILPWKTRWQKAINSQLLTRQERRAGLFSNLKTKALLQGNIEQQTAFYTAGRQWSWFTPNDIMRFEDGSRIPADKGGDEYLQPLNMIPGGTSPTPEEQERLAFLAAELRGKPNGHAQA